MSPLWYLTLQEGNRYHLSFFIHVSWRIYKPSNWLFKVPSECHNNIFRSINSDCTHSKRDSYTYIGYCINRTLLLRWNKATKFRTGDYILIVYSGTRENSDTCTHNRNLFWSLRIFLYRSERETIFVFSYISQ